MSMKTLCAAITSSRHPIRLAGVMATALAVSSVSGVAVAAGFGAVCGYCATCDAYDRQEAGPG